MAQTVPKGPLAARFADLQLGRVRAGARALASVAVENAGTVAWRDDVHIAYHWLDAKDNPIVWDGIRTALPRSLAPGEHGRIEFDVAGALPPGRYRFALDLVVEHRAWFGELGGTPFTQDADVLPRIERRLAVEGGDPGPQEEPLVPLAEAEAVAYLAPGVTPAPDWSRRILDAHQAGYGIVGGSIELDAPRLRGRHTRAALAPWQPGSGRVPRFPHPLLCPSVTRDAMVEWSEPICGLPAARAGREEERFDPEPSVYDGRITARLRFDRRRA
jgi:hypothetical protein